MVYVVKLYVVISHTSTQQHGITEVVEWPTERLWVQPCQNVLSKSLHRQLLLIVYHRQVNENTVLKLFEDREVLHK